MATYENDNPGRLTKGQQRLKSFGRTVIRINLEKTYLASLIMLLEAEIPDIDFRSEPFAKIGRIALEALVEAKINDGTINRLSHREAEEILSQPSEAAQERSIKVNALTLPKSQNPNATIFEEMAEEINEEMFEESIGDSTEDLYSASDDFIPDVSDEELTNLTKESNASKGKKQ